MAAVPRKRYMTIERTGGDCAKTCLIIYTLLFWISGLALIFIGLWMLLDPKRNYILDLVDFSEDDPLLTFASYIALVTGIITLFVGFIGCCGAIKRMRCLLVGFMLCLVALFCSDVAIGTLALTYRNKFDNGRMPVYLQNLTYNRYSRDKWVKPLMDTVQFYIHAVNSTLRLDLQHFVHQNYGVSLEIERHRQLTILIDKLQFNEECCGSISHLDYSHSRWHTFVTSEQSTEEADPMIVPLSCCRQITGATALHPVARSPARCQHPETNSKWRHMTQKCCGGRGPQEYENSFWFITNTERGTRSFVPPSCCKQKESGRAWAIKPTDPMCITYKYYSQPFNSSVNIQGCHEKLLHWFDEQTWIFAGVGFGFAALMVIGMVISLILCNSVNYYTYIQDDH